DLFLRLDENVPAAPASKAKSAQKQEATRRAVNCQTNTARFAADPCTTRARSGRVYFLPKRQPDCAARMSNPVRGARHDARTQFHREFCGLREFRGAMFECRARVARFVDFHLVHYCAAFFVLR